MALDFQCRICGNKGGNTGYRVREMMFGYRDTFVYFECSGCACLQIAEVPLDLSKYYPPEYGNSIPLNIQPLGFIERFAKNLRSHLVFGRWAVGRHILRHSPSHVLELLRRAGVSMTSRILDVGCGNGGFLFGLWNSGFRSLLGVDPYIERSIHYPNGMDIMKCTVYEVQREWDLITFHHSFEHISDPLETLRHCAKILATDGFCLIRVPVVPSYAWRAYRTNWAQIDAPRHSFIYSAQGLEILGAQVGLRLTDVVYDSTEFQFWASEQYARDIALRSDRSYWFDKRYSIFSENEIQRFKDRANFLNEQGEGDQAAFYLKKVTAS